MTPATLSAGLEISRQIDALRGNLNNAGWRDYFDRRGRVPGDAPLTVRKIAKRICALKTRLSALS